MRINFQPPDESGRASLKKSLTTACPSWNFGAKCGILSVLNPLTPLSLFMSEFRKRVTGYFCIEVPEDEPNPKVKFGQYFRGLRDASTAFGYKNNELQEVACRKNAEKIGFYGYCFMRANVTGCGKRIAGLQPWL